jgi:shikimate dehydrogenase
MQVFCILGDARAAYSKSPAMFSKVMQNVGLNAVYVPFKISPEKLGSAMGGVRALNIAGANVTAPFKEAVIPHLDLLSEGAQIIGAVNTITCNGSILKGYNTNAIGFMKALEKIGIDISGKPALVFGSGGAARAVIFMLKWLNADPILIAGRTPKKIDNIVMRIGGIGQVLAKMDTTAVRAHIVVNATSVSNRTDAPEMTATVSNLHLSNCRLIVDLNYGKTPSIWQELARAQNVSFMDGLPILAQQARNSFFLWTGMDVEVSEFMNAIDHSP